MNIMFSMRIFVHIGFSLVALGFSVEGFAATAVPESLPAAQYRWVDALGRVLPNDWPFQGAWVWGKSNENDLGRPVFRAYVQVPPGVVIDKVSAGNGRFTISQDAKDSPFGAKGGVQFLTIDTISRATTAKIQWREASKRAVKERSLIVELNPKKASSWLDESCKSNGVDLQRIMQKKELEHLFIGLACVKDQGSLKVTAFWSSDAALAASSFKTIGSSDGSSISFVIEKPSVDQEIPAGKITLRGTGNQADGFAAYSVSWNPRTAATVMHSAGLAFTYLSYEELPQNYRFTEIGVTGKYQFSANVLPRVDASVSGYVTLIPVGLGSSPASIEPCRFYGLNGRAGYLLTEATGATGIDVKVSLGAYLWGMLASNYGVSYLLGPQLYLSTGGLLAGSGRSWGAYVKFAPISDAAFSGSLSNREIAAGGSLQVAQPRRGHPLFVTLDVAHASVDFTTVANKIRLLSIGLGLSYAL